MQEQATSSIAANSLPSSSERSSSSALQLEVKEGPLSSYAARELWKCLMHFPLTYILIHDLFIIGEMNKNSAGRILSIADISLLGGPHSS